MTSLLAYAGAALAVISGCFAVWSWLRLGASVWWLLPGLAASPASPGRSPWCRAMRRAAPVRPMGGVYIATSLLWLWAVEGRAPTAWNLSGATLCLAGAGVILAGAYR